jgi:hypothetical protein
MPGEFQDCDMYRGISENLYQHTFQVNFRFVPLLIAKKNLEIPGECHSIDRFRDPGIRLELLGTTLEFAWCKLLLLPSTFYSCA